MISAFADLLDGEDPAASGFNRISSSYGGFQAGLVTYWAGGLQMPVAIEHSVDPLRNIRADIVETSVATNPAPGPCEQSDVFEPDWRDAWDYAHANGALGVMPAGNKVNRTNDECTANTNATRDDMLVVGGFGRPTNPNSIQYDSDNLMGYPGTDMSGNPNCAGSDSTCFRSAYGGAKLRYGGGTGVVVARSRVDVIAPDTMSRIAWWDTSVTPDAVSYIQGAGGTSISAPLVASGIVSLLDWAGESGFSLFADAQFKHVNAILMADGTRGVDAREEEGTTPSSSTSYTKFHPQLGRREIQVAAH